MRISNSLTAPDQSQQTTSTFLGYNHSYRVSDGQQYDNLNLSTDNYPMMSTRKLRTKVMTLTNPQGMISKDVVTYVADGHLVYNGEDLSDYLQDKGISLSTSGTKDIIGMGAYLVILPDKVFINTAKYSDCGYIDNSVTTTADVTITPCKRDGTAYSYTASAVAPSDPTNGQYWIDTSGESASLKIWSETSSMWISQATTYLKISSVGIGTGFSELDGVTISGLSSTSESVQTQLDLINGSKVLYDVSDNAVVVVGLLTSSYTQSDPVTLARTMPDMDYVTESQNRLWGCKYGVVNGSVVNCIYCCALGDFKNWNQFLGISTDSWAGDCGSDGEWTGAITYGGYPMFFKENRIHKVYISSEGAHQIIESQVRGVQKGSSKSLAIANETLYYLSRNGVCVYSGSQPSSASDVFGDVTYTDGKAESFGNKYYLCCKNGTEDIVWCYDTSKSIWHKESGVGDVVCMARSKDSLYIMAESGEVWDVNGVSGETESDFTWMATSGRMGIDYPQRKYVSRLNLKLMLEQGSEMSVKFQYDSDGIWRDQGTVTGAGDRTFMLPIRPRRCDHFYVKLSGTGTMKMFTYSKILEYGSDVE